MPTESAVINIYMLSAIIIIAHWIVFIFMLFYTRNNQRKVTEKIN